MKRLFCALLMALPAGTAAGASALSPPPDLFEDVAVFSADARPAHELAVVRERVVRVNVDLLTRDDEPGGPLTLNLFADLTLPAVFERRETQPNGAVWSGRVAEVEGSRVVLALVDGAVAGTVSLPDATFAVRPAPGGLHRVLELDRNAFPPERCDEAAPLSVGGPLPPEEASDDGALIDVYIAYTPAARAAVGGTAGMNALITQGIADTNQAYANSGVIPRLRLVGSSETAYTEANNLGTDLGRLAGTSDGIMDEVHALRDQTRADLVSLIVTGSDACGVAYLMSGNNPSFAPNAFSVTHYSCIQGNYTLAHEMGHNMGLNHARTDPVFTGAFPYSFGYKNPANLFRDVMSYYCGYPNAQQGSCPRIQHFSNPSVTYTVNGTAYPTGIAESQPDSAHNALSLNNTRVTVANFRQQLVVVPAVTIGDASVVEGQIGATSASFAVSLSAATTVPVTVDYATGAGTATPGTDYTATSGKLTIPAGSTSGTISVTVAGDRVFEADETFTVNLSAPTNATLGDAQATGTILNDDGAGLSIGDVALAEPTSGTRAAIFTVTLAPAVGGTVSVQYATSNGTATSPADFVATAGTLSFPANVSTQTIPVTVNADAVKEGGETFTVTLSNPTGAALAYPEGTGRIFDPGNLFTVTPCRLADTRTTEGPALSPGADRVFAVAGRCGLPSTARAASVNVTVTLGTQAGDLRLYAAGSGLPLASAINYGVNQTRANNAVIPLGTNGQIAVRLDQATGSVHMILDVNGYVE